MQIGVLGLNHKAQDLPLREMLAKACEKRFNPRKTFLAPYYWVLLSTCNRTEIYFSSDDLAFTHSYLLKVLRYEMQREFEHQLYSYFGLDCFNHLAKVTSGLDSAILAETEIQGQVRQAYETTRLFKPLSKELHFLFQKSLKLGKEIRSNFFTVSNESRSLEEMVGIVIHNYVNKDQKAKVLFVGASEINKKIGIFLRSQYQQKMAVCNRSEKRLKAFASDLSIDMIPWQDTKQWSLFDIVIVGTKACQYLIHQDYFANTQKQMIIDLSVPRNVDPNVASFPGITLFNIDQIYAMMQKPGGSEHLHEVHSQLQQAVEAQVINFLHREKAKQARMLKA